MIDLKKEQKASIARERCKYSMAAKFFFFTMDLITGKGITLAKAKLLEMLASIPYRAWEFRQYERMTRKYQDQSFVQKARTIMIYGRESQDNEYWHLLVINEKMKEDGVEDPWYLVPIVPFLMVSTYVLISRALTIFNISRAFLFNAEFEDHAEHVYAELVEEHPEWDTQPINSNLAKDYGDFHTWGDVFRRIGLDERDHMNNSFVFCGKPEAVVKYKGMPEPPTI
jgi:demethoxyubiquinone hydroxylase (CLK1/Coq7/Cat5 family)